MTEEKSTVQQIVTVTHSTDQQTSQSTTATIMTTVEVAALSVSNGGGACATSAYHAGSADIVNKRLSFGSITLGLWELAVKSAIRIASARTKSAESGEGETPSLPLSEPRALPPLPAVPPVGPGGRRSTLTRSQSDCSKFPPTSRPRRALTRSQSMAELLTAMVAAKLRPTNHPTPSSPLHDRSVCAYCSTYQRVTSDLEEEENETDPPSFSLSTEQPLPTGGQEDTRGGRGAEGGEEGGGGWDREKNSGKAAASKSRKEPASLPAILHRVCRKCASDMEGKQALLSRSWTQEFSSLRQFFKQGRHVGSALDNHHLLPPRIPRVPPMCEAIARSFVEECKKNVKNKSLFQATSASFNAGLQYALKPPDQKLCATCSKLLRFPVERKTCALCDKIFCRNCSSRDLALSAPDHLDPGDPGHKVAQIIVRILPKEEAEELDKHSSSSSSTTTTTGTTPTPMHRYRACHRCRDDVAHVLRVMTFNDTLTHIQAEMVDLQEQIAAVLEDQDLPSPGIGVIRWPSVRSVHAYTSMEDEFIGEAVSQRVAQKLLGRFFQLYQELERLAPETLTQTALCKHVKQAMSAFYVMRRSVSSKRFNRQDSIISLPPSSTGHFP